MSSLVTAPILAAAAMLGVPLAGSAHALERIPNCGVLRAQDMDYYTEASDRGDWLAWAYYNGLRFKMSKPATPCPNYAASKGC
jgi:hypothetical protein